MRPIKITQLTPSVLAMTHKSTIIVLLLAAVLLLSGCASSGGANVGYLLEQDYARMNDAQLTAYEQEVSDELAASAGDSSSGVSLGLGVGSWGSHSGVGLGVEKWLGGGGGGAQVELRDRREAVREEMRRRGLLPAAGK